MRNFRGSIFGSAIFLLAGLCWGATLMIDNTSSVKADDTILQGGTVRKAYGSTYWSTSNLREWLNSNASSNNVQYTSAAPNYKSDYGFLNQFTKTEQDSIAVTKHKALLTNYDSNQAKDGGNYAYSSSANTGFGAVLPFAYADTISSHNNWYYQNVNDKVYLPTIYDVYRYVEARNQPIQKTLTPQAKAKNQINNDPSSYWLNMPDNGMASSESNHLITSDPNNVQISAQAKSNQGVAPIIFIKPDTKINNTTAANLKIDDTVTFGKYLDAPIEWTVINKVNGYAMLMTKHVIDFKQYDNSGDYSYKTSKYVNYDKPDVDVTNYPVTANDGSNNTTVPLITISNEDKLSSRQNSPYSLHFDVKTYGSALDYVILPNGQKTTASSFDYTFNDNSSWNNTSQYVVTAVDKAGNTRKLLVPVSNINPPSSVLITPSTTGWSNKPVTVDVLANNNVGQTNYSSSMYSDRDKWLYSFPNYTTYSGKKLHVKYTLTGGVPTGSSPPPVQVMLAYKAMVSKDGQYNLVNRWITADSSGKPWSSTDYKDIANGKTVTKEATFDVPADYNSSMSANMHMNIEYDQKLYPYSFSNFNLNVVDNDDFGVKSITLPSGKVINSSSYTDTLNDNGTYTYKVLDSRGQTTTKTVTVKIDKENPTTTISGNPTAVTNQDVKLHAAGNDTGGSGVSQMQSPQGEWVNGSSLDYTANQEGKHTYTFGVKDNAGNTSTNSVTVDIDKTAPSLSVSGNPDSITHKPVSLSVSSTDDHAGVKRVQTPDGTWHSGSTASYTAATNGNYKFVVEDNAGNQTSKTVSVSQIGSSDYVSHDDNGSLIQNNSKSFGTVVLSGTAKKQDLSADSLKFGDTKGSGWKLLVSSSPFSNGMHQLRAGSLQLGSIAYSGPDQKLNNLLTQLSAIDSNQDVPVLQAPAGNSGEYLLNLDNSKFLMNVPANAYTGTYKTQITWKLQH
jgi:hypothetical protein